MSRMNDIRQSTFGQLLFFGYLVAILVTGLIAAKALVDVTGAVNRANRALCSQKASAQSRIDSSRDFLRDHPNGVPQVGLTKILILRGIHRDTQIVRGFSDIHCPPDNLAGG
jgi:hypothetical protein